MRHELLGGAATLVVALHLAFIVFAVAGAALLWRWPRLAWLHAPAALWAAGISVTGGTCPLTPLENRLRAAAGDDTYAGGFVEHHLLALVYPQGMTPALQFALGVGVAVLNLLLYAVWWHRRRRGQREGSRPPA